MFKIEFQAHDCIDWQTAHVDARRAVYELLCALNYTGFSYRVSSCGIDVTEAFEIQMNAERTAHVLPVAPVAGGIPKLPRMACGHAYGCVCGQ